MTKAKEGATEVKVGYLHTIAVDDKLWLGQSEGQWADAGLDIKTTQFDTGIELSQALAGGSIDVAIMGGVTSNFPAQGQGKIFMLNSRETATARLFVQADSGIKTRSPTSRARRSSRPRAPLRTSTCTARWRKRASTARRTSPWSTPRCPTPCRRSSAARCRPSRSGSPSTCGSTSPGKGAKEIDNAGNYPDAGVGDGWIANNDWYAKNQPTVKKIIGAWLEVNEAYRKDPEGSLKKVHELAYKDAAKLTDLQHQVEYQKDYTNEEWLAAYENGDVLKWVGDAEKAYVELGGVPKYVDPKEFFDTSLFIEAAKAQQ